MNNFQCQKNLEQILRQMPEMPRDQACMEAGYNAALKDIAPLIGQAAEMIWMGTDKDEMEAWKEDCILVFNEVLKLEDRMPCGTLSGDICEKE